jgi:hypothetical protein
MDLLGGEDVDVAARTFGEALDLRDRVERQTPYVAGAAEYAMEDDDDLVARARRQRPIAPTPPRYLGEPRLDRDGRDVLEATLTERRQQMRLQDRLVVEQRRAFAPSVMLDVAEVLGGGIGNRRAGPDHPWQRAAPRLAENVCQPGLGALAGIEPGRRPPPPRPRGTDPLAYLAAVR